MAATAERQHLTEVLLDEVQRAGFPSAGQLDRVERLISTREELEEYIAILIEKTEERRFQDHHLLDRIERLLQALHHAEQAGS